MIAIDYGRDRLLSDFGVKTLKDRYLIDGENSPQEALEQELMELILLEDFL